MATAKHSSSALLLQSQLELLSEYEIDKNTFTNGNIQFLANKMMYIETSLKFDMDEFCSYKQIKLNFKPEKATTLKLLFL